MASPKYDFKIDLDVDNAHTRVIRLVGQGKKVLELGCATGYMSKVLIDQFECDVTGIEMDVDAAAKAEQVCSRVITGDLDDLDIPAVLSGEQYDVIVCADVLEHLRDPVLLLSGLRPFLRPDGHVVASIPNIAHLSVIVDLIKGDFTYRPMGILDETHLRFFTRHSISECFERSGFVVTHLERLLLDPEKTEFGTDLSDLPTKLADFLRSQEDSTTYQFILCARSVKDGKGAEVLETELVSRKRRVGSATDRPSVAERDFLLDAEQAMVMALLSRMKYLEDERETRAGKLGELRERVETHLAHVEHLQKVAAGLQEQLQEKAREILERETREQGLRRDIDLYLTREEELQRDINLRNVREEELQRDTGLYRSQIQEIVSSPSWKLAKRLQRMRLWVFPNGSRRERVYRSILRKFGI